MEDHPAFEKAIVRSGLIFLGADVTVVALEAEFRWEFGEPFMHVHFNPVVLAALFVRWLEGAVVTWAIKGDEFVEAITKTAEGAASAIDNSKGVARFAAVDFGFTNHLLGDFNDSVKDVADCTAKFTSRIVA